MKGYRFDLDFILFELGEYFGGEVKAGGGGRGAAGLLGEDGLVAVAVLRAVVAADVGREGHMAYFVEDSVEVWAGSKAERAFAELACGEDFGFKHGLGFVGGVEEQAFAGLDFAAGADEGAPVICGKLLG